MGWRLCLAALLLVVESSSKSIIEQLPHSPLAESGGDESKKLKSESIITKMPASERGKVKATVGSMLPPKHEIVLNLPAAGNEDNDSWRDLEHINISSKFRNTQQGSSIVEVRRDEVQIQNTDGTNKRLPPFAFNEDVKEPEADSTTTEKSASSTTQAAIIDDDSISEKNIETSAEIRQRAPGDDEHQQTESKNDSKKLSTATKAEVLEERENISVTSTKQIGTNRDVEDLVNALESSKELPRAGTTPRTQESEVFNSIAEYNRWIAERAAKRKQIREDGYRKYQQIMFKSGRNIVPVGLFFDTDPIVPPRMEPTDEFAKRAITSSGSTDKKMVEKVPVIDEGVLKDQKTQLKGLKKINETETMHINSGNTNIEPGSIAEKAVPVVASEPSPAFTTSTSTANHQVAQSEQLAEGTEEELSEEAANSGLAPPSTRELQEELLFVDSNDTMSPPAPEEPSGVENDKPESGQSDFANAKQQVNSIDGSVPSPAIVSETAKIKETQRISVDTAEAESAEGGSSNDRFISSTSSPLVTLSVPVSVVNTEESNRNDTLPPLLAMPSLNSLSSFSSLNSKIEIATKPQTSEKKKTTPDRLPDENRTKSSGVLGLKGLFMARNQKRKLNQHSNNAPLNTVDSDRNHRQSTVKGRQSVDRSQFIRTRPRKVERGQSSDRGHSQHLDILRARNPVLLTRTHPAQQIFESNIIVPGSTQSTRIRQKSKHIVSNTQTRSRQQGIATDFRTSTPTRLQVPVVQMKMTKSAEMRTVPPKGGFSFPRKQPKQPTASARTLTPPLTPTEDLQVTNPLQQSFFPFEQNSEWDRIRAEFLRIKRQHKRILEMQRKNRERATAAGVITLKAGSFEKSGKSHQDRIRKGESDRGIFRRQVNTDEGMVRVDIDRSRHTVDRDAPNHRG
ncbi:hypothetical protein V3C99_010448 [Haemonchus contortus]